MGYSQYSIIILILGDRVNRIKELLFLEVFLYLLLSRLLYRLCQCRRPLVQGYPPPSPSPPYHGLSTLLYCNMRATYAVQNLLLAILVPHTVGPVVAGGMHGSCQYFGMGLAIDYQTDDTNL